MDSVLHMCLDTLALQSLQHPEAGSTRLPCTETCLTEWQCIHSSVSAGSQSHAACRLPSLLSVCTEAIMVLSQTSFQLNTSTCAGAQVISVQERPQHRDFLQLQDQSANFSPEDRKDWLKACRFLRAALSKALWPGMAPTDEELMSYIGRIVSNNFG